MKLGPTVPDEWRLTLSRRSSRNLKPHEDSEYLLGLILTLNAMPMTGFRLFFYFYFFILAYLLPAHVLKSNWNANFFLFCNLPSISLLPTRSRLCLLSSVTSPSPALVLSCLMSLWCPFCLWLCFKAFTTVMFYSIAHTGEGWESFVVVKNVLWASIFNMTHKQKYRLICYQLKQLTVARAIKSFRWICHNTLLTIWDYWTVKIHLCTHLCMLVVYNTCYILGGVSNTEEATISCMDITGMTVFVVSLVHVCNLGI